MSSLVQFYQRHWLAEAIWLVLIISGFFVDGYVGIFINLVAIGVAIYLLCCTFTDPVDES